MDLLYYILAGAGVGFAIGLTGIGGGSLMTPLLIMFGIPFHTAIGTDLLYAAITKMNSAYLHHKKQTIHWRTVYLLGIGSIPSALITAYVLRTYFEDSNDYKHILTLSLGIMLILTAGVLFFRDQIQNMFASQST
ncbi:MAG: sulfite exporter TauE/SafE family protein, partial [Pseudomonadota bacterium]